MSTSPRATVLLCLAAVYVVWSSTYLVMRWAVADIPPFAMGAARFLIAGSIMFGVARARGLPRPDGRQWRSAFVIGGLMFIGGNGFVAVAEQRLPSATAAVVCATMLLWLALLAAATGERPSRQELLGHALGFAGVVVLVAPDLRSANAGSTAVLLLSPVCWATGSLLSRRLAVAPGMMGAASQMLAGGAALIGVAALHGERVAIPSGPAMAAMAYLIVFGSVIAFSAYAWLIRHTRPALASSYAFVNPPLAVGFGVVFGEHATASLLVATPLIATAVVLVLRGKKPRVPDDGC